MKIISYDIRDDKTRTRFTKMLTKHGAIRLQYYVYEFSNSNRLIENIVERIKEFAKQFCFDDSVIVFDVNDNKMVKYGNAIHRDKPIVYF